MLFAPPVFGVCYRKFFGKRSDDPNAFFKGIYKNFYQLREELESPQQYYWPRAIQQEFEAQKSRMRAWSSISPPMGNYRTNFLPTSLALFPGKKIRVLDIGGGLNNVYEYLKFSLNKEIYVTVFEQFPAVENGIKLYGDNPKIKFVAILPETNNAFDVVYLGSSIQYFPDFRRLMNDISKLNPTLIVIADSSFGISETFACKQVNMSGVVIPYLVINKDEFENVVGEYGYECVCRSMNRDATHHFDGYEYPYNLTKSWNFVFRRSDVINTKLNA